MAYFKKFQSSQLTKASASYVSKAASWVDRHLTRISQCASVISMIFAVLGKHFGH